MLKRLLILLILTSFFCSSVIPAGYAADLPMSLPKPGTMVDLSPAYDPLLIKGLTIHKDNPFLFDFIIDTGNDSSFKTSNPSQDKLKQESDRLVKYFFACLTIPEQDLWVNLSPYEKDQIIPKALGQTALGRDLLAEDYVLKQITASLIYPERDLGKDFWNRVYAKAQQLYGTNQVPVNTFNKVWILADKATIYEHGQSVFVLGGHLKVMLDQDYLALKKHGTVAASNDTHSIGANIVREIILPEIEKEVNTGKNFASLRQIFNSLILATWYKNNLKQALLNKAYADKSTVKGIDLNDATVKEKIYQQYLQAYKKGVFNYIKEDVQVSGEKIPRKYFSGGFKSALKLKDEDNAQIADSAMVSKGNSYVINVRLSINDQAMVNNSIQKTGFTITSIIAVGIMLAFLSSKPFQIQNIGRMRDGRGGKGSITRTVDPTIKLDQIMDNWKRAIIKTPDVPSTIRDQEGAFWYEIHNNPDPKVIAHFNELLNEATQEFKFNPNALQRIKKMKSKEFQQSDDNAMINFQQKNILAFTLVGVTIALLSVAIRPASLNKAEQYNSPKETTTLDRHITTWATEMRLPGYSETQIEKMLSNQEEVIEYDLQNQSDPQLWKYAKGRIDGIENNIYTNTSLNMTNKGLATDAVARLRKFFKDNQPINTNPSTKKNTTTSKTDVGGIDLDTRQMNMDLKKDPNGGVQSEFDPNALNSLIKNGVVSAVPLILKILPISSADISSLIGNSKI